MTVYNILDQLNDKQQEAVTANDQNILVLSEAGSRKTRVLVNRILLVTISEKYIQWPIIVITFVNKADSVT